MQKTEETLLKLLRILKIYMSEHGYPPSIRELMNEMNVKSTSTIFYYLSKLEDSGKIKRNKNKNRAIEIIPDYSQNKSQQLCDIPKVVIKKPFSFNYYNQVLKVSADLFSGDIFALNAPDCSMTDAGILKGDLVIIKKCSHADDNDIVLCIVNDEPVIRRFLRQDGNIELLPCHVSFAPHYCFDVNVLGKVVGIIRQME